MVIRQRRAVIAGITGQDGSYMAELLIAKGYKVFGITRDVGINPTKNILHISNEIDLVYSTYELHQLIKILKEIQPDEVYNLTGQSYVAKSWDMLEETIHSHGIVTCRILEAILQTKSNTKFLNASSAEVFAPNEFGVINEDSLISPYNPYGCAKAFGHSMVDIYRKTKGIFAVNAILFPHESPRRNENFVFKKIIDKAISIKNGNDTLLRLGNLNVLRDWGYAPSYVKAMYMMLQLEAPENFCLCTGEARTVENVVDTAFSHLNLKWTDYVVVEKSLIREMEHNVIVGDPSKARNILNWEAKPQFFELITKMLAFEDKFYGSHCTGFEDENPCFE